MTQARRVCLPVGASLALRSQTPSFSPLCSRSNASYRRKDCSLLHGGRLADSSVIAVADFFTPSQGGSSAPRSLSVWVADNLHGACLLAVRSWYTHHTAAASESTS